MKKLLRRFHRNENAQVLWIFALLAFILIGLMGLATDIGRIYVARAELGRSVDAAALAGAKQLPDIVAADAKARSYISENEPSADVNVEVYPDVPSQQVEVRATKTVGTVFLRALGVGTVKVRNQATAGFGTIPVDAYLAIDATGSMHRGDGTSSNPDCNAGETGGASAGRVCPIKEAKDGAKAFVNTLIATGDTSGSTVVGVGPFRGCYNPPKNTAPADGSTPACIVASGAGSMVTNLTSNKTTLTTGIDKIWAIQGPGQPTGGSGTNICQALKKGQDVLFNYGGGHTASNTLRYLVILTDGDNVYNADQVNKSTAPLSPESPCRPTNPATNQGDRSSNCRSDTQAQENQLDTMSYNIASALKSQGVQIFVIAFSVCGGIQSSSTLCDPNGIGGTGSGHPDSIADHRLLKCIASSSPGTNDRYFETTTAAELPAIFQQIAQQIAFRLIK
jgi:hypothetical protein